MAAEDRGSQANAAGNLSGASTGNLFPSPLSPGSLPLLQAFSSKAAAGGRARQVVGSAAQRVGSAAVVHGVAAEGLAAHYGMRGQPPLAASQRDLNAEASLLTDEMGGIDASLTEEMAEELRAEFLASTSTRAPLPVPGRPCRWCNPR